MAELTGMTAEAIDELFAAMVTSLRVDDTGQLLYKNKRGDEINAGPIVGPKIATEKAWPVGSIFICANATNPNTLTGVGTWARFGQGRVLVSQYDSDSSFDLPEETGGAKTVTLTAAQSGMPYHAHSVSASGGGNTGGTSTGGRMGTVGSGGAVADNGGARPLIRGGGGGTDSTGISQYDHTHGFSVAVSGGTSAASADASQAHENMPPYIVVYMWKRTA